MMNLSVLYEREEQLVRNTANRGSRSVTFDLLGPVARRTQENGMPTNKSGVLDQGERRAVQKRPFPACENGKEPLDKSYLLSRCRRNLAMSC